MEKWKILKVRPHYIRTTAHRQTRAGEESDSDDDFDLPKGRPPPYTPPPQMQQREPQGQYEAPERLAGPLAPQVGRATARKET